MIRRQSHRGPEGEGYVLIPVNPHEKPTAQSFIRGSNRAAQRYLAALGHCRLKILDLSPLGHQPMERDDRCYWVTYNGEIYNYVELRDDLRARGHEFRSNSDTEVLLAAYQEWGEACLDRLNGMFAFALWDGRQRSLFCARDRFGEKPFYYHWNGHRFLFASEIKGLLEGNVPVDPDPGVIYRYLTAGVLDDGDGTFFREIHQLEPGHSLRIDERGLRVRRYWTLPRADSCFRKTYEEVTEQFRELLIDAVRIRLRSDVAVGSCLSGGLDSSSIVCLMSRLLPDSRMAGEGICAFSACFDDPRYDERPFMESIVKATGAEWHQAFPRASELQDQIEQVVAHADEPFGSTSIFAQWTVMRLVSARGIKVVLDGQGADELLGGYPRFLGALVGDDLREGTWGTAISHIAGFARRHGLPGRHAMAELGRALLPAPVTNAMRNYLLHSHDWIATRLQEQSRSVAQRDQLAEGGHFQQLQARLLTRNGLRALLRYEDRNAMAFGIEARLPFLDHRLVECFVGMPAAWHFHGGWTKAILRDALNGLLPNLVRDRRDKIGFATPEATWFRTTLKSFIREILSDRRTSSRGFVNARAALALFDKFAEGGTLPSSVIWRWINLELWCRQYVDTRCVVSSS